MSQSYLTLCSLVLYLPALALTLVKLAFFVCCSAQVEELRQRLEEKNRHIEKKTSAAMSATQDRNRMNQELTEMRDHMDIKDRKINVLQRKVGTTSSKSHTFSLPSYYCFDEYDCRGSHRVLPSSPRCAGLLFLSQWHNFHDFASCSLFWW